MNRIDVNIAGLRLECQLRFSETAKYFPEPDPATLSCVGAGSVCVSESDWDYFKKTGVIQNAYSEYNLLCFNVSDAMLLFDRMLIHGVALRWRDRAYLICAGSGVGKSTQARFLQELCPGEFGIICGDRPALEFCQLSAQSGERCIPRFSPAGDEFSALPTGISLKDVPHDEQVTPIIVHPSPWNGKENWHGAESAPLAGIILLERGLKNDISAISPWEAAIKVFYNIIQTAVRPDHVQHIAELETRMLHSVPVWKLTTFQAPDSTRLLLDAVFREA